MKAEALLRMEHLQKSFGPKTVLADASLELNRGEFLCLLGPSGCGKSTLLRLMAGLEKYDAGVLNWATPPKAGFVFQDSELLPWRTVLENTQLPLELQKSTKDEQKNRAVAALKKVGLQNSLDLFPHELSGGMKMRVSIARALSATPSVLFLDEPFAALDEVTRFHLQNQLRDLSQSENLTVIFVTHSLFEAAFLADRVLMMSAGGGKFILNQKISYSTPRSDLLRAQPEYQKTVSELAEKMKGTLP